MKQKKEMKIVLLGTDTFRGKEIKGILNKRKIPFAKMDFFDPDVKEEYGKITEFRGEARMVHPLDKDSIVHSDLVFLAADRRTNREYGSLAAKNKYLAVDLSETFNEHKNVPLVVAGVNHDTHLRRRPSLVANPHAVTIILAHLFYVLLKKVKIKKAVCFILQPVSAFDEPGITELANQSFAVLSSASVPKSIFKDQIAFNLLSHTEAMDKNGFSSVEKQILSETRRVLGLPDFPLSLSVIQAPVFHTYSVMIHLETESRIGIEALGNLFKKSDYFQVSPPSPSCPVSSVLVAGKDHIFIGQIKKEKGSPGKFWIWAVADNLTRGSALNAIEIMEKFRGS
jgi:aspartate-semialdehyde dehydrogenase